MGIQRRCRRTDIRHRHVDDGFRLGLARQGHPRPRVEKQRRKDASLFGEWVAKLDDQHLLELLGCILPTEAEASYYAQLSLQAIPTGLT